MRGSRSGLSIPSRGRREGSLHGFPPPVTERLIVTNPPERLCSGIMNEVTRILRAIDGGDPQAADQLLPLVYDELRQLAAQKLARERPGLTLQATALVHEAYLRLVMGDSGAGQHEDSWDGRRHFLAAAAEAMRRILVERARRRDRVKHGGGRRRVDVEAHDQPVESAPLEMLALEEDILALDRVLPRLAEEDPAAAEVVRLHFFAGVPLEQIAQALGISRATAYRQWAYARAWLRDSMRGEEEPA